MIDWKVRAAEVRKEGYLPGGTWEKMLARHLSQFFPDLVRGFEAEGNLEAYLQVMTYNAMDLADRLENQGLNPESARELAMEQLLPNPESGNPETDWELEGAQQDAMEAVRKFLLGNPSPSRPPPKTRPTYEASSEVKCLSRRPMAIRLSDLLNRIPDGTHDRVDRTRKRLGTTIREALRQETGLLLNRLDSALPEEKHETISVPVTLVEGLPECLHDFEFDNSLALALEVSPYRRHLEQTKAGMVGMRQLMNKLGSHEAGQRVLKGREKSAEFTLDLVNDLLVLIDREDPIKQILGINEDVLGAYIYRSSLFRGQNDDPAEGKIELYWGVIGLVAEMLGVGVEPLAAVVLIHELGHAYTHLGADIDGRRWGSRDFAESDHALKEGLAQYYTHLVSRRIEDQFRKRPAVPVLKTMHFCTVWIALMRGVA